uniref:Uncharacterized protein n=1 Tax=Glossina austeni TaxID=7395 RepID=A0A1A9USP2_GLOAU
MNVSIVDYYARFSSTVLWYISTKSRFPLAASFAKDLKQIQNSEKLCCVHFSGTDDPAALKPTTLKSKWKHFRVCITLGAKRKEAQKENTNSWQNSIYIKYKKYEKLHLKSWLMFSRFTDLATQQQYQLQHQHQHQH